MSKKVTYLLLALALPGLIFAFLKLFGRNHFDIPIYYQDGVADLPGECGGAYSAPYVLPDSILHVLGAGAGVALLVDSSEVNHKELAQLRHSFPELQVIALQGTATPRLDRVRKCALFLKDPWKAVLVDRQRRIRGYYSFLNLEETDRLKVEVEILLKNN